jgi:cysteinyl-tRNA synthetase
MVRLREAKMAKSVGNIFLLHEALDAYGRDALIMYYCGGHYRQPIEFDDERMEEAAARVQRITEAGRRLVPGASPSWSGELRERFFRALAQDFNTPDALAAVFTWVRRANSESEPVGADDLREMLGVLGLDNLLEAEKVAPPADVLELVEARERARTAGDFAEADNIREQIGSLGWEVRDGPEGPEVLPAR